MAEPPLNPLGHTEASFRLTPKPKPISSEFLVPVDPAGLCDLPLFPELAEAELVHLAAYAEFKTSNPGDVFIHEGASGYTFSSFSREP